MAKFKKLAQFHEGKVVYFDTIVNNIVFLAVSEIPFVELMSKEKGSLNRNSSVRISIERDLVYVDVDVKINYTQSVSDAAFKVQEAIRHNIEAMTEYKVEEVNVNIFDVTLDDVSTITFNLNQEQSINSETTNETTKEG